MILLCLCTMLTRAGTFIVTSNADSGPGTLRDAITQAAANGTAQTDFITFNIADLSLAGRTIDLQAELPALSSNLVIDASSQPGLPYTVTDAKIIIRHMNYAPTFSMLKLFNVSNVKIYGLYLYWGYWQWIFTGPVPGDQLCGIDISNAFNIEIGAPGKGNVINSFTYGIHAGDGSDSCRNIKIRSNYIGTGLYYTTNPSQDIDVVMLFMTVDIHLANVFDCTIGGPTPAEGNVLTGNRAIDMDSKYSTGNGFVTIQYNHFSRWYDKLTFIRLSNDIWNYNIHIGRSRYILNWTSAHMLDYKIQVLDNDIPTHLNLDHISSYFTIQGNHFESDNRGINQGAKALFASCPGGGIVGSEDFSRINYFRWHNTLDNYNYLSVFVGDVGPITNLKNVYECNSIYGSTISSTTLEPYIVPFAQIGATNTGSVTGIATPSCRIDLYYDDECTACEGKIYIGKAFSDASGNWQYSGPVNGTVVATATDATGRTGDFSAPRFFTSKVKMVQPSCGKNNGSITGITSDGAENFYWQNLRTGVTVSNSIDLTNVGAGEYLLFGVHGGTCIKPISQSYTLEDQTPVIQAANAAITQPGCGKFNGSISNIFLLQTNNIKYSWINEQRQIIRNELALTNAGPGKYKLIVEDTVTGCMDSTAFYDLINQAGPSIDINTALINAATCSQSNGSISNIQISNISGAATYVWLDASGKIVGNSLSLTNVPAGDYKLQFKDGSACDLILTPAIKIGNIGLIRFDSSALLITPSKCSAPTGSIRNIAVNDGSVFKWTNFTTRMIVGNNLNLLNASPGYYRLTVIGSLGCVDSTGVFYVPQQGLVPLSASFDTHNEACERKDGAIAIRTLTPTVTNYDFEWVLESTGQTIGNGSSINNLISGNYSLHATDENGCSQKVATVSLGDDPAPVISSASIVPDICGENNGAVSLSVHGSAPFIYSWYDETGRLVTTSEKLTDQSAGSYYAIIADDNHCSTRSSFYIIKDSSLLINPPLYDDQVILKGSPASLTLRGTATGEYFLFNSSGSDPVQQNASGNFVTGPLSADTIVYVLAQYGNCSSIKIPVHIKVVETLTITMPNSFTPNGDGHNDIFRVKYPQAIKTFQMTIFNRWGQKVFETSDPYRGWDGTLSGLYQPGGNYVWFIYYQDILGNSKKTFGNLVLIR